MKNKVNVNVKMYRMDDELGDCFLITFKKDDRVSTMLLDFGTFNNHKSSIARLREIATNITEEQIDGKIDIAVGTHQHNDHLNGYYHAADILNGKIEQVWLSWLDDPKNHEANEVRKIHSGLHQTLTLISKELKSLKSDDVTDKTDIIDEMVQAYGDEKSVKPALAMDTLKQMGRKKTQYLLPGKIMTIPSFSGDEVRVYVLGPPVSRNLLRDITPGKDESYDKHLSMMGLNSRRLLGALKGKNNEDNNERDELEFPFNAEYKIPLKLIEELKEGNKEIRNNEKFFYKNNEKLIENPQALLNVYDKYKSEDASDRVIDGVWLDQVDRLSLFMDSYTNNSSLCLAIELVQSGKVLLFPGDAQTGNWNSWFDVKFPKNTLTTEQLMENTVLYKVGHHGSHNATLVKALEMMKREDLIAMIPVHKKDKNITSKTRPWKMPATNLLKRLKESTENRVLRMDDTFEKGSDPSKSTTVAESWKAAKLKKMPDKNEPLFVEIELEG